MKNLIFKQEIEKKNQIFKFLRGKGTDIMHPWVR